MVFRTVIASLIIHLILGIWLYNMSPPDPAPDVEKTELEWVDWSAVDGHKWASLPESSSDSAEPSQQPKETAQFLAEQTRRVSKQTVVRPSNPTVQSHVYMPPQAPAAGTVSGESAKSKSAKDLFQLSEDPFAMPVRDNDFTGTAQGGTRQLNLPLGPTIQFTGFPDDIATGSAVLLNTDRHLYTSFYRRLGERFIHQWEPAVQREVMNIFDRDGWPVLSKEFKTIVEFVIDREGNFVKGFIHDSSGYKELDQAHIDAFKRASPYPNPPVGMVKDDGTIRIFAHLSFLYQGQDAVARPY